ncbi:DUF3267 domain-containing protein [Bacillus shivajii]|uniref:DUF3267 domain-containing protein n=1 Tax=Bacillus shivajii TaxID=1983719 RepID=UPI001CFADA47|nr:DUF3267 domain-containing protein [Bacillus shivajii]UCZ53479.1 DUF3267 domain-containing protein [Bacillus shivajii]
MKYARELPKTDDKKHADLIEDGFKPLKEPGRIATSILLSLPLMFMNAALAIGIIALYFNFSMERFGFTSEGFTVTIHLGTILAIFFMIIVHELIHAVFVPRFFRSNCTYLGLTCFGGFVYTEERMTKARFIIISVAPFVILSIFLPIILGLLGMLTPFLVVLIVLNAAASSVDMLAFILVLKQVPNGAVVQNNGIKTYWKKEVDLIEHKATNLTKGL